MTKTKIRALLAVFLLGALPGVAAAQFPPAAPPRSSSPTVQDRWPEPPKPPQAEPLQQKPAPQRRPAQAKPADSDTAAVATPAAKPKPKQPGTVVACGGVFGKDSSHLKLAQRFDSRNIVYGEVDGPEDSKIPASILYPRDPKRRLEVLWRNEASRSETSLVAINGKSQWVAPHGLKLGLTITALEKLNGRPFKLTGFGADGIASVTDWDNGKLAALPGGCKVGLRLFMDAKSSDEAREAVGGDKELLSNDAGVRALKPTVSEILIGY